MLYRKTALRVAAPVAVAALALTACGGGDGKKDSGDRAKAGARAAGESATGESKEGLVSADYEVTAQKVELGTEAETAKMVSDPEEAKGLIPAVAHVKYTYKSATPLATSPRVSYSSRIWADGRRGTLIVGAADGKQGCEAPRSIKGWKRGESHVLCETYLVPENAKDLEVHWSDLDGEAFVWKFEATR
ncbi:hypothetical protein ABZ916_11160 [Streptomyces sp. NPDC046853]|uniref:hypothetical protein n=1 Tax=Streptomyces sp. NPDC046853 TaxID=3154920 RepID=UPI00340E568E